MIQAIQDLDNIGCEVKCTTMTDDRKYTDQFGTTIVIPSADYNSWLKHKTMDHIQVQDINGNQVILEIILSDAGHFSIRRSLFHKSRALSVVSGWLLGRL